MCVSGRWAALGLGGDEMCGGALLDQSQGESLSSSEGSTVPLERLALREEDFGKCSSLSWKMDEKSLSMAAQVS